MNSVLHFASKLLASILFCNQFVINSVFYFVIRYMFSHCPSNSSTLSKLFSIVLLQEYTLQVPNNSLARILDWLTIFCCNYASSILKLGQHNLKPTSILISDQHLAVLQSEHRLLNLLLAAPRGVASSVHWSSGMWPPYELASSSPPRFCGPSNHYLLKWPSAFGLDTDAMFRHAATLTSAG